MTHTADLDRLPAHLDSDDYAGIEDWLCREIEAYGLGDRPQSPPAWMLRLERWVRRERRKADELEAIGSDLLGADYW